ncbi:flagellar basal body rod protein [Bacillus sp. SCS-151]|uniref:lmo0954 family membrane protein n=1 Tax=Nanhaiella sioensis TaxID=3115293 RepID=UPI00397B4B64
MKNVGLFIIGGIAAMVLISSLGPMVGLAINLLILYLVFKQFMKTKSTFAKFGWALIGIVILMIVGSHIPAVIGFAAAYVLYIVYKKWNASQDTIEEKTDDPFVNFEKQWSEMKRYN